MKSIHFLITTYDRTKELRNLLGDITEQGEGFKIHVSIQEDGRTGGIDDIGGTFNASYSRQDHQGKKGYWKTINNLWGTVKDEDPADYYIQLPDDARLLPGAIGEIIRQFELLPKDAICLNLRLDKSRIGVRNWKSPLPTIERHGDTNFFRTDWVDMAYIARREFFEALHWKIEPINPARWARSEQYGSGVGLQITNRLRGRKMYQVRYPVIGNDGAKSVMNPWRTDQDKSEFHLDPIIGGMATMPGREKYLEKAISSVYDHVDQLIVYYNGSKIPSKIFDLVLMEDVNSKISIHWADGRNEFGFVQRDYGDSAKFLGHTFRKQAHYYFTFDDDLKYPADHVWRLYHSLQRLKTLTGKDWIVGTHGRRLPPRKVRSFYRGCPANYHWRKPVNKDAIRVHMVGTGTSGFHSNAIKLSMDDFPLTHTNMADIHLGIAAQKQGVPMAVVRHPGNYFKPLGVPQEETIYGKHRDNDRLQTEKVNSIDWRLI